MGRFLSRLFSKVLGNDLPGAVKEAAYEFEQELGLSLNEIIALPQDELVATLLADGKFDTDNLEKLANVLALFAERQNNKELYHSALYLYQHLEKENREFSVERNTKISRIRQLINQ